MESGEQFVSVWKDREGCYQACFHNDFSDYFSGSMFLGLAGCHKVAAYGFEEDDIDKAKESFSRIRKFLKERETDGELTEEELRSYF